MHWYLIHTKPRQESCALKNLIQQGYTCYLPVMLSEKLQKGSVTLVNEPLFPRYLFVQLGQDHQDKSWGPIRSTKGVSRFVCFGTEPAKVDNQLIDHLRSHEASVKSKPERLFNAGERVKMCEGAFAGVEGIYQMALGEQRAMVLIELLSKQITLRVTTSSLRKAY